MTGERDLRSDENLAKTSLASAAANAASALLKSFRQVDAERPPQTGNSHVVAKGETLTSIAKFHKVSVEELQRFNHIENDRRLQIGQTIMIPPSAKGPSTTASPGG